MENIYVSFTYKVENEVDERPIEHNVIKDNGYGVHVNDVEK